MKYWFSLAVSLLLLSSCATKQAITTQNTNIKEVVADIETLLVDVRIKEEFERSTAPNAINIPLAELEKNLELLKGKKKVVVFCNRGKQADKAVELLHKNGLDNVYDGSTWQNVRAIQDENKKQ